MTELPPFTLAPLLLPPSRPGSSNQQRWSQFRPHHHADAPRHGETICRRLEYRWGTTNEGAYVHSSSAPAVLLWWVSVAPAAQELSEPHSRRRPLGPHPHHLAALAVSHLPRPCPQDSMSHICRSALQIRKPGGCSRLPRRERGSRCPLLVTGFFYPRRRVISVSVVYHRELPCRFRD